MYVILRDIFVQLLHIPAGEFTNWLLMGVGAILLIFLIFK